MDLEIVKSALELAMDVVRKILSWIPARSPRKIKARGSWDRRREARTQRMSGLDLRLRTGFWLRFQRRVGIGKFEPLDLTRGMRDDMFQMLVFEAQHYEFSDRGSGAVLEAATVVDAAIDVVWKQWEIQPREARQAVLIVEEIARYLISKYNVRKIDRRIKERRASAGA